MSNPILEHFQETSRAIDFNPEPEIMHVSISENQPVYDLWRKLQGVINKIRQGVEDIHVAISNSGGPMMAYCKRVIVAGDLADAFGTNDQITLSSETAVEFDFTDPARYTLIQLGGGPPMIAHLSSGESGDSGEWQRLWNGAAYEWIPRQGQVWRTGAKTLVARKWNTTTHLWDATPWVAGWTVRVWQVKPGGLS